MKQPDYNMRIKLDDRGRPMSAMGEYGRIGLIGPDDAEEEWDDDSVAWDASAAGISDADLYADEINFHHFKQFRINAIVHEKRGVVGFSKTRRHDTTKATAQWIREIAGERRGPELTVIKAREKHHDAGFHLPPSGKDLHKVASTVSKAGGGGAKQRPSTAKARGARSAAPGGGGSKGASCVGGGGGGGPQANAPSSSATGVLTGGGGGGAPVTPMKVSASQPVIGNARPSTAPGNRSASKARYSEYR